MGREEGDETHHPTSEANEEDDGADLNFGLYLPTETVFSVCFSSGVYRCKDTGFRFNNLKNGKVSLWSADDMGNNVACAVKKGGDSQTD